MHAPVAALADSGGSGAMDDRRTVDVGDDAALLHPVEKGHEARLGAPADRAGAEAPAFEGTDARSAGRFVGPLELLERAARVLYVDRCPERGTNAARGGAKARVGSDGQ